MRSFTCFCLVMAVQVFGYSKSDTSETKIVGGQLAARGQFPHQAALALDGRSFCGGTLISDNYILTTASCTLGIKSPLDLMISLGGTDLQNDISFPVSEIIIHPEYNNVTTDNDAALLKTEISLNTTQPIELPARGRSVSGNVTISGWGSSQIGGPLFDTLMYVNIPFVDVTQCKGIYGIKLTENMLCVGGSENRGSGPCRGDTGGPAIQDGVLVGIVSIPTCGRQSSVLTNVASPSIRDFITENTNL